MQLESCVDVVWAGSYSSNSTRLETSYAADAALKKQKNKQKKINVSKECLALSPDSNFEEVMRKPFCNHLCTGSCVKTKFLGSSRCGAVVNESD